MTAQFHLFFRPDKEYEGLLQFGRTKRNILHAFFLAASAEDCVSVYKLHADGTDLLRISTYCCCSSRPVGFFNSYPNAHNFGGSLMPAMLKCLRCNEEVEEFENRRGKSKWASLTIGTAYELCLALNATLDIDDALITASDEPDEEGEWDGMTQPLVDGTAILSAFVRISVPKSKIMLITRSLIYDSVTFITNKPERLRGHQTLSKLLAPLGTDVWLACIGSMLILLVSIAFAIFMGNNLRLNENRITVISSYLWPADYTLPNPMNYVSLTAGAILKPVVCQPGICRNYRAVLRTEPAPKILLTAWFVALIVLICSYTTTMTSNIVLPVYNQPPSTFEQLADSGYTIYTELWTSNFVHDFASLNNTWSAKISTRVIETNVLDNDVRFRAASRRDYY